MVSRVSVCSRWWTVPMQPLPMIHHYTGTPLVLTLVPLQTWDLGTPLDPLLVVASDGDHLRPVQTCSFGDLPPGSDIWWQFLKLRNVRFPSVWYASYWNAFLFIIHSQKTAPLQVAYLCSTTQHKSLMKEFDDSRHAFITRKRALASSHNVAY